MNIDMSNYNIPNCNIQKVNDFLIITNNRIEIEHVFIKEIDNNLIDMLNDINNSIDYIREFLSLNMFNKFGTNSYYNDVIMTRVKIYAHGYSINDSKRYKSHEFLEIMREKLELNNVNKLVSNE